MYKILLKRIIDFTFSFIALIVLIPVILVISLAIVIQCGLPVFFYQERVGKNWKKFKIIKFRTMINGANNAGPDISTDNDSRITNIGRFLRKYKLDEIPQLWNILKGEMSIVGPRPEIPKYVNDFSVEYTEILKIKPGLSDYAALEYSNEAALLKSSFNAEEFYKSIILPEKIKLYKRYINEISFLTDIKIILRTVKSIVRK
jgi:lipopolysaccharide/colanic/teichoic acid biosynthesis glycosyltransferase